MTQIEELQGRILAAMERIGTGVVQLEQARAEAQEEARAAADNSDLELALEEEKTANAQLEERVKVLHDRLKEAEQAAPAADNGDMEALQAELELLRNEVGNTDEKDALKLEVTRLKGALESAGNGLAAEKEALETELSDLKATNQQLMAQIEEVSGEAAGDLGDAVDQAALQAELNALKAQLAEAQASAAAVAPPQDDRLQVQLDELRQANQELLSTNEALRESQARDQAQVNAVLTKLEPLLANAQNLPEGEEV
ncbi:colicin transporter [Phaeobacter sp. 11ANDIMAR09]|uniref:colicin transporter n=1 Tax=Phaeobacter sp. 11ANDIMAR09 TaxID=1225647 RepID=UPI0006C83D66|nr:colicin transporter [Phaeobacter sp. 11ANDIMAR09]KPD11891.1 colicin transporter [Phaeobacter sp. 11ANDIMAR09]